ncbi:MAG: hypothetical protein OER86_00625 [Phycisphaerae bacterium]|nr:hypothetical protein [Phycisphaerae bacterium]
MNILKEAGRNTSAHLIDAIERIHHLRLARLYNEEVDNVGRQLDAAYTAALSQGKHKEAKVIYEASEAWAWRQRRLEIVEEEGDDEPIDGPGARRPRPSSEPDGEAGEDA